jgi:hypothetical protein
VSKAADVARRIRKGGYTAEVVKFDTPSDERRSALERLRNGKLNVIVNYETMTEGVDVPRVRTIVLGRSVSHDSKFVQITGRALRAFPGKKRALLVDLVGASGSFYGPTVDRTYSLTDDRPMAPKVKGGVDQWEIRCAPERGRKVLAEVGGGLVDLTDEWLRKHGRYRKITVDDWSKTNAELARENGVSVIVIRQMRLRLGKPSTLRRVDFSRARWSETNASIAKSLGCSVGAVRYERRRLGINQVGGKVSVDLSCLSDQEWEKSSATIARRLKLREDVVRRERARLGKAPFPSGRSSRLDLSHLTNAEWLESNSAIANRIGRSAKSVAAARVRLGKPASRYFRRPIDFSQLSKREWDESNEYIARRVGCCLGRVSVERRKLGKLKYTFKQKAASRAA